MVVVLPLKLWDMRLEAEAGHMRGIIPSMAAMATRLGNGLDISFMAKVAFMAMIQG